MKLDVEMVIVSAGIRPRDELAKECGYDQLPTTDPDELNEWFQRGAKRGSLPLYLEGFAHTCAVMQTEEALERVAREEFWRCIQSQLRTEAERVIVIDAVPVLGSGKPDRLSVNAALVRSCPMGHYRSA